MLQSPLLPNLLYLILVAGLWLAALSVVTPGSGVYEALAILALVTVGVAPTIVPLNLWALVPVALGVGVFGVSIWRSRQGIWLVLSAILLTLGSAFLFRQANLALEALHAGPQLFKLCCTKAVSHCLMDVLIIRFLQR